MEGYHLPDLQMNPIDLLPKGVKIRPVKSASPRLRCYTAVYSAPLPTYDFRRSHYRFIQPRFTAPTEQAR